MRRSRPVSLALVGLFLWVTGCTSYKVIPASEVAEHAKVRITLTGGERETLYDPWIEGDSIKGVDKELVATLGPQRSVDLPNTVYALNAVVGVEAVGTDEVGTVFTVLGVTALVGAIAFVIGCSGQSCDMM